MTTLAEVWDPSGSVNTDPVHDARGIVGGIDCSPRRIGYCFMYQDTEEVLISGTKHIKRGDDLRLRHVAWGMILNEYERTGQRKHQLLAIGIEDAYVKFPRQAIETALSVGNMEAFMLCSLPWVLIDRFYAATWRSILGIKLAGKEPIMEHALRVHAQIATQDEADAICIAQATARRIVPF
jgi:Holliday junction resolvasome RuvABC endonuclease subunit